MRGSEPDIFRGQLLPDLLVVGGGFYALGALGGFFVGGLLQPFFRIDPQLWGRWAAHYVGIFGVGRCSRVVSYGTR